MKNKRIWITTAVLLAICISVLWAADTDSPKTTFVTRNDTLKGLQGFYVMVENLTPEEEKHGITSQQLQTDVELKLRQNGIRVLTEQKSFLTVGVPCLYVNLNLTIDEELQLVAYNISIDLHQMVLLERDLTKRCDASTWTKGITGFIGLDNIKNIRERVKDTVNLFVSDYLAVNPKN